MRSYFEEFKKNENVCLILLTYIPGSGDYKYRSSSINEKIDYILEDIKMNKTDLPCYHVIDEVISTYDMPNLYKSVDSFILPTRGEGIDIFKNKRMGIALYGGDDNGITNNWNQLGRTIRFYE
jgi:hypothetical protein